MADFPRNFKDIIQWYNLLHFSKYLVNGNLDDELFILDNILAGDSPGHAIDKWLNREEITPKSAGYTHIEVGSDYKDLILMECPNFKGDRLQGNIVLIPTVEYLPPTSGDFPGNLASLVNVTYETFAGPPRDWGTPEMTFTNPYEVNGAVGACGLLLRNTVVIPMSRVSPKMPGLHYNLYLF